MHTKRGCRLTPRGKGSGEAAAPGRGVLLSGLWGSFGVPHAVFGCLYLDSDLLPMLSPKPPEEDKSGGPYVSLRQLISGKK